MTASNSSETARATLRTLGARKLPPTPENFASIFHELSGAVPLGDRPSRAFASALTRIGWLEQSTREEWLQLARAGDWEQALDRLACAVNAVPTSEASDAKRQSGLQLQLLEQIACLIEFALPALGEDDPKVRPDAEALALECRQLALSGSLDQLCTRLTEFNQRLPFVAEEQIEVRSMLLGLLRLIFENIGELTLGDAWMQAQVQLLMAASEPPLNLRRLDDLQRRLKDVIFRQGELKRTALAAQEDTKRLFAAFIERLSEMADLSGAQSLHIEACAKRVESAHDLSEVGAALSDVIGTMRMMAAQAAGFRDELTAVHQRVIDSEAEVTRLQRELEAVSLTSRHDALTGTLNRRGLDEALLREVARMRRVGNSLSIALLDVDDFKTINDRHGHAAGDAALSHLADTARAVMRAQDTLCRYGGEEFVILMPDTTLDDGIVAIRNLQRELTRHFFMAGSSRVLITFSAGVAVLGADEDPQSAIERADKGMYQAKRRGKNRVVVA